MRIGMFLAEGFPPGVGIDGIAARARRAEELGLSTGWLPHVPWSQDALTAVTAAAPHTTRLQFGTAVVPTWSRHPYGMAQQALSTQLACGGRLLLGIGPSHQAVAEKWYGGSYQGVIHHVREYLAVLQACLDTADAADASGFGAPVRLTGERYPVDTLLGVPGAPSVPVYLAALAPLMLRLAGERAAGTITWMGDERTHESHVVPRIGKAAEAAGRPRPRVVAGVPVAVCDDHATGRDAAERRFGGYRDIPAYARMLARGDAASPADVALVGTEDQVSARLRGYESAGVTDIAAMIFPVGADAAASIRRTEEFLGSWPAGG
jgi:F420-dependent oxidoreductase-like protein